MFQLGCASRACFRHELLSGLTVALALVLEAFAFVAGVEPLVGLYAAFMVVLLAAIFGGRPGMISGATGAMAVVMVHWSRSMACSIYSQPSFSPVYCRSQQACYDLASTSASCRIRGHARLRQRARHCDLACPAAAFPGPRS